MIITNTTTTAKTKEMPFGTFSILALGEEGRGRREMRLPCPEGFTLEKGVNLEATIGVTKSGRPRIDRKRDNTTYLLLSAEGGYTRRGNGWVGAWKGNTTTFKLLSQGNGADGAAGRIGYWDVVLLKVIGTPANEWYRIRTSGGGYGTSPQWLHLSPAGCFLFEDTASAVEYADSINVEFPNADAENITDEFKDVTE